MTPFRIVQQPSTRWRVETMTERGTWRALIARFHSRADAAAYVERYYVVTWALDGRMSSQRAGFLGARKEAKA